MFYRFKIYAEKLVDKFIAPAGLATALEGRGTNEQKCDTICSGPNKQKWIIC